jgi:hypothetical protein
MIRVFIVSAPILLSTLGAIASPRIAFERGNAIWIANADGSGAKEIAKGSAPDLSPDGSRITFTIDTSTKHDLTRRIAVAESDHRSIKRILEQEKNEAKSLLRKLLGSKAAASVLGAGAQPSL